MREHMISSSGIYLLCDIDKSLNLFLAFIFFS